MMKGMIAGSISPQRVPITRPSRGVKPIDVSTETPFFTAFALDPFPMWKQMRFVANGALPRRTEARLAT